MSLSSPSPELKNLPTLPSRERQAIYFLTGSLGGLSSLPISLFPTLPSKSSAVAATLRAGSRFWTFDMTRHILSPLHLPIPFVGALGGAAGGFTEVMLEHLTTQRTLPTPVALKTAGTQSLRLFCCFGTYTFLSTRFSERTRRGEGPPRPFAYCWGLGIVAGATGSAVVGALEGVRGRGLWGVVVPRGALTIGTVISVHVTSCAALLSALEVEE